MSVILTPWCAAAPQSVLSSSTLESADQRCRVEASQNTVICVEQDHALATRCSQSWRTLPYRLLKGGHAGFWARMTCRRSRRAASGVCAFLPRLRSVSVVMAARLALQTIVRYHPIRQYKSRSSTRAPAFSLKHLSGGARQWRDLRRLPSDEKESAAPRVAWEALHGRREIYTVETCEDCSGETDPARETCRGPVVRWQFCTWHACSYMYSLHQERSEMYDNTSHIAKAWTQGCKKDGPSHPWHTNGFQTELAAQQGVP